MKKIAGIEKSQNGIGVSTTARIFARRYYASQGNTVWASARNNKLNDVLAMDFIRAQPAHRYLTKDKTMVIEVRVSGPFTYHALMRGSSYDILVIRENYKKPRDPEISRRRLENLEWSKKMSTFNNRLSKRANVQTSTTILHKLANLANRLDSNGFYEEASKLDAIIKSAGQPSDMWVPPNTWKWREPPKWEEEGLSMWLEEKKRNKEQEKHEELVEPGEAEDLGNKHVLNRKMEQGYDTDTDLLLKMQKTLEKIDPYDYEHDYEESPYKDFESTLIPPEDVE